VQLDEEEAEVIFQPKVKAEVVEEAEEAKAEELIPERLLQQDLAMLNGGNISEVVGEELEILVI